MRTPVLVAIPVDGPLTADQLVAIIAQFHSVHQFQRFDQFSVVFISDIQPLQLDRGAMESIIDYLTTAEPNCRKTAFLTRLTHSLVIRPRPEPEVIEAAERKVEPVFDHTAPKFRARVRFNLRNGRQVEEARVVNSLAELDHVLEHGPYDEDIRNIKIKLEIQP
ncbi:hypothetical protein [Rhizobium sp. Leaf383]|uniref:hypothetical protein n=1 Tax=Rhizobium sp. Leaf383 TaxID=1736357 RepID=UPI000712521F|nr:hypothetical protein [Rhizobium sp. Leaf383]KQS84322.1 hypothetical protein ASG58_21365 [Rhizobium sp. Leaf383]